MTRNGRKQDSSRSGKGFWGRLRPPTVLNEVQQNCILLLFLCLALTVVIVPKGGIVADVFSPGDIATRDIKAPRDMLVEDRALTEKRRAEAEEAARPVFDFDARVGLEIGGHFAKGLRILAPLGGEEENLDPAVKKSVEQAFDISLSDEQFAALTQVELDEPLVDALRAMLVGTLERMVVANLRLFETEADRGVVIRDLAKQQETAVPKIENVLGMGEAQELLRARLKNIPELNAAQQNLLFDVAQRMLRPSLTFNKSETEARRKDAAEAVKPVFFQIKKGEMIVREGERISEEQIKKLRALRDLGGDFNLLGMAAGLFMFCVLLVFTGHRFALRNIRKYRPDVRDLLFMALVFIGLFVLMKLGIFVSTALESAFPYIGSTSYYYAFPFAVGAMLIRLVLNSEVALVFAAISAILIGVLFGNSLAIAAFAFVSSVAGAHWVRQCKTRATLYRAGLWVSLANVGLVFALHFLAGRAFELQLLHKLAFAFAGGILCAVIVTGTIPLVESLFKYTTDIKLLELANMNAPVLRELMVQAPGTYHHSIIVGNLVEAAAEEINANPLLARVAAYYHDIGKIKKPLYFIENTGNAANRHDKLAPSMSALILMAHVKDGVEVARESKLGQPLVDIIRQHHGTALIKFFYDKAKSKEDPGVQQVDERDYRYPGPRPQTREAALIMLADAVEAASRTLTEPTPARIQGMVQKIINNIFIDGQLDECELTLKDMHNIAKSFNRILAGIFHHRVDYPEPAYKERDRDGGKKKSSEDSNREPTKEAKDREASPAKGSTEDLKRLGMS
ncbi:metal dependent phosphohydrolase [Geoalkalibacter ferrihydriticus]|uniref:Metal dependent phosphohydrolase n=1 Tax=Geoalkalibacter ferrihydriticus TaxID=392333 RepID=A0A1G9UTE8_9BACT|nr:HDIG domain-containing metalloprotein [Geoalkalibacter ferrihydriticus]SDM63192.1 metal dependent phosphohydrolase [Geoalkalibacter ferrihydriticus]